MKLQLFNTDIISLFHFTSCKVNSSLVKKKSLETKSLVVMLCSESFLISTVRINHSKCLGLFSKLFPAMSAETGKQ